MTYTVYWVPIGPEMSANCMTLEEAVVLRNELLAVGHSSRIRVAKDGKTIDLGTGQPFVQVDEFAREYRSGATTCELPN